MHRSPHFPVVYLFQTKFGGKCHFHFLFFSFASNFPCKILWNNKDIDANICIFQIAFSQWRAGLWKKLFWDVFLRLASFIFMKNFSFHSPALHIFFIKKMAFFIIFVGKIFFLQNIYGFTPVKKILSHLDQKWAQTKQLLSKKFQLPIAMEGCIVHWFGFLQLGFESGSLKQWQLRWESHHLKAELLMLH